MKKLICSLLISVMGFTCLNMGAVSAGNTAYGDDHGEVSIFETYENNESQNRKAKKSARAEVTTTETEVNELNYNSVADSVCVVTFDCNDGTYDGLETFQQTVNAGSLLSKPDETKLERYNSTFRGWYTADDKKWYFDSDTVSEDIVLKAKWDWDNSFSVESLMLSKYDYLLKKYPSSTSWKIGKYNSTNNTTHNIPIEIGGKDITKEPFPDVDIEEAISKSGIASSYGGCGPLAMMGVMDYFARYLGYTSIMDDPTNSANRVSLAYQIFKETKTYEGFFSGLLSDDDDKTTITYPSDYVNGFNTLMKDYYHLNEQIVAKDIGFLNNKSKKINQVIQSIDNGYPVTVYVSLGGNGQFANHYVNVYEYETWKGIDKNGNALTKYFFNVRMNWGWTQYYNCHMDADLLSEIFSGVIYYDVKDSNQLVRPSDFAKDFVNSSGQGQYFFYEKTADITTADGFKFGTTRLRCGYIENEYLVLSANREGAGLAYLEMNFDINVKAINFDISRWSSKEGYIAHVKLYYKDSSGNWQEQYDFNPVSLTTAKGYMDNYYMSFPESTQAIKFEVYCVNPTGDTNKGRIVLGDMNLFY